MLSYVDLELVTQRKKQQQLPRQWNVRVRESDDLKTAGRQRYERRKVARCWATGEKAKGQLENVHGRKKK